MRSANGHYTVTSPVPREVWESLYRSDEKAVVSQSLAWRDSLLADGRYQDASLLYEFPSGRQVLMPMARRRLQPPGATAVASWPQVWGIGGPITQAGQVSPAEAAAVLGDVARRGTLSAAITLRPDADRNWLSQARQFRVEDRGCYVVDLDGGFGEVWQHRFRSNTRRAVRKAERSGLDIEVDRSGRLLDVFYDLYQKSLSRWAAVQHEPLWFTRLRMNRVCYTTPRHLALVARHFGADCAIWVAWHKGQPAAANIILRAGTYVKAWRGAMDKEIAAPVCATESPGPACHRGCLPGGVPFLRPGGRGTRIVAGQVQGEPGRDAAVHARTAGRTPAGVPGPTALGGRGQHSRVAECTRPLIT